MVVPSGPKYFFCSGFRNCQFGDGRVWADGLGRNAREEPKAVVPFFQDHTHKLGVGEREVGVHTPSREP